MTERIPRNMDNVVDGVIKNPRISGTEPRSRMKRSEVNERAERAADAMVLRVEAVGVKLSEKRKKSLRKDVIKAGTVVLKASVEVEEDGPETGDGEP